MAGPKEFMVTKGSAERISNHIRDIDHLPSEADHRGLVRFEHPRDPKYMSVIDKIKSMAAQASQWKDMGFPKASDEAPSLQQGTLYDRRPRPMRTSNSAASRDQSSNGGRTVRCYRVPSPSDPPTPQASPIVPYRVVSRSDSTPQTFVSRDQPSDGGRTDSLPTRGLRVRSSSPSFSDDITPDITVISRDDVCVSRREVEWVVDSPSDSSTPQDYPTVPYRVVSWSDSPGEGSLSASERQSLLDIMRISPTNKLELLICFGRTDDAIGLLEEMYPPHRRPPIGGSGVDALLLAVLFRDTRLAESLLFYGFDPNKNAVLPGFPGFEWRNRKCMINSYIRNKTAVHLAVGMRDCVMLKILIKGGALFSTQLSSSPCGEVLSRKALLLWPVSSVTEVLLMLDCLSTVWGVNDHLRRHHNRPTWLYQAVGMTQEFRKLRKPIITFLLDNGASTEGIAENSAPIFTAITNAAPDAVAALLHHGTAANQLQSTNDKGQTPLLAAVEGAQRKRSTPLHTVKAILVAGRDAHYSLSDQIEIAYRLAKDSGIRQDLLELLEDFREKPKLCEKFSRFFRN